MKRAIQFDMTKITHEMNERTKRRKKNTKRREKHERKNHVGDRVRTGGMGTDQKHSNGRLSEWNWC